MELAASVEAQLRVGEPLQQPRPAAAAAAAAAFDAAPPTPPTGKSEALCRHWARAGSCLAGDRCRFAHPQDVITVPAPRRRTWGGTRAAVRNRSKSTVLRRLLIDAFGREALAAGSGVLDVAGGKVGGGVTIYRPPSQQYSTPSKLDTGCHPPQPPLSTYSSSLPNRNHVITTSTMSTRARPPSSWSTSTPSRRRWSTRGRCG
jgi:hypothetical protein